MRYSIAYISFVAALITFSGCATPPKPTPLVQLQAFMKGPEIQKVKSTQDASKFVAEARQYQRLSEQSYAAGEMDDAKEYGLLGYLKVQTAYGVFHRKKIADGIESTNSELVKLNNQLQNLAAKRSAAMLQIQALNKEILLTKRANAIAAIKAPRPVSANKPKPVDRALQAQIDDLIAKAKDAQLKATNVDAERYSPQIYNLAVNKLNSIETYLETSQAEKSMVTDLNDIIDSFGKAFTDSQPQFQLAQAKADPVARRQSLRQEVSAVLDPDSTIEDTPGGIRIILPALFAKRQVDLTDDATARINKIAQVLKNYDDFNVQVEGFSSDSKNFTVSLSNSQIRAQQIAKILEDAGLPRGTVEWRGIGASAFRFPAKDAKNDRVEVAVQRFD